MDKYNSWIRDEIKAHIIIFDIKKYITVNSINFKYIIFQQIYYFWNCNFKDQK